MVKKVAIIGDLSGHFDPFLKSLTDLGIKIEDDKIVFWPKDLLVIQVGDLIHKGPDSTRIIDFIDGAVRQISSWVQLFGNHESQYLGLGAPFFWNDLIEVDAYKKLLELYHEGFIYACASVKTDYGDYFISHAGLSAYRHYNTQLGNMELQQIVMHLNANHYLQHVIAPGMMLNGTLNQEPGIIWAEARIELRHPWLRWAKEFNQALPFSQIHGHSAGTLPGPKGDWKHIPDDLKDTSYLNDDGHFITEVPQGGRIIGIDPIANKYDANRPIPYVLEGTVSL